MNGPEMCVYPMMRLLYRGRVAWGEADVGKAEAGMCVYGGVEDILGLKRDRQSQSC
jgi:hypothetical protein